MKISLQIISLPLSIHTVNAHAVPGAPDFCPSAGGLGGFLHLLMVKEWTATVGRQKSASKTGRSPLTKRFSLPKREKKFPPSLDKQRLSGRNAMRMSANCVRQKAGRPQIADKNILSPEGERTEL